MAIIKCKMCGGDMEIAPDKTFGTCEYCGSTMTMPKVDDDQRAAAFNRGNHFRRTGEFDKALSVYERIVQEDDTDAEAHWCCALCRFGIEYVEDPATYEWLPTCHRASFDSFLEDVDYLAAVEHSDSITRRQYQKDAAKIAEVQKDILATSQNEDPFDVFICYKESDDGGDRTRDSILAQEIFYQLTEQGRRVFFSRITLEDKAGTEYEPYIFAALNSAKVMVAVGTTAEHFNAVWVKNEWSRFLALMRKDRKKLLLPCYRDMDPYDLPEQLSVLQSYDMGKIGFMQDLTRGISKVLDADKTEPAPVKETVVVQHESSGNISALLKRGNMALEDGAWDKADGFFEEVLNQDAECAEAYFGKFLAEQQCKSGEAYIKNLLAKTEAATNHRVTAEDIKPDYARRDAAVRKYQIPGYLSESEILVLYQFDFSYNSAVACREWQLKDGKAEYEKDRNLARAEKYARGQTKQLLDSLKKTYFAVLEQRVAEAKENAPNAIETLRQDYAARLNRADEKAAKLHKEALERREQDYQKACKKEESAATILDYQDARAALLSMNGYKDSAQLAMACEEQIAAIQARAEKQKKTAARKRKIRRISVPVTVIAVIVAVVVIRQLVVPSMHYREAETLFAAGNYDEAISKFTELGQFRDAKERISAVQYAKAEHLLVAGDYDGAISQFTALGQFQDAAERANAIDLEQKKLHYAEAARLYDAGDHYGAIIAFSAAGQYEDAEKRLREIWESIAVRETVAAGTYHTVGLKTDGTVVAVGNNDYGQCDVSGWTDMVAVSAGDDHTVGLKTDGTVVAVGDNDYGQCDISDWTDMVTVSAGGDHTVGLKTDGTVVAVGDNDYGQCDVSDWTDMVAVSAGFDHTVGLKVDGTVVAAGGNYSGQCDVSSWTDIVTVSADSYHTVGLKANGTVVAVGNDDGQCDVSAWTDIVAVAAGDNHTVGLKTDGTVVAAGGNSWGQCDVSGWREIVAVSAGNCYTVGQKADGTVVAMGFNESGQCNVKDWTNINLLANYIGGD